MVFCTEFLDGWWSLEPLRGLCTVRMLPIRPSSGALDVESQNMVFCDSTSNAPDDGRMYPKHSN